MDDNIKMIKRLYEAFGRGEIEAILDAVTDDVDWATDTLSTVAPWFGVHRGKEGVGQFFQQFGSTMEVEEFTPVEFGANADSVFAIIRCRSKARATGKVAEMNLHHFFKIRDGKIAYYRGTEDTSLSESVLS